MPPRRASRQQPGTEPPPAQPDITPLVEAIRQAFVQMSSPDFQLPPQRERLLNQADHLQRFMRLQPGQYDGRLEPLTAIAWLREMLRYFRAIGTPKEYWAIFAIYRLTGNAIHWWETVELMQNTEGITWEDFERLFRAQYAHEYQQNEDQQDEIIARFERLTQGNRTINEYLVEFTELASIALGPNVNEKYLVAKFKSRLSRNIFNRIGTQPFHTLPEIVIAAQRAEVIEVEQNSKRNQHKRNERKATKKNQGQWSAQGSQSSESSNNSGSYGDVRTSPYGSCFSCGQPGHRKKDCLFRLQKSLISQEGQQKSQSGPTLYQTTQARSQQSQSLSQAFTSPQPYQYQYRPQGFAQNFQTPQASRSHRGREYGNSGPELSSRRG